MPKFLQLALAHALKGVRAAASPAAVVPLMVAATHALGSCLVLRAFVSAIDGLSSGSRAPGLTPIQRSEALIPFSALCDTFALWCLSTHGMLLLLDAGCLPAGSLGALDAALTAACARVRPNAVPLVDAFLHTDEVLGSALGGATDGGSTLLWSALLRLSLLTGSPSQQPLRTES